jgi:hypothetical protein
VAEGVVIRPERDADHPVIAEVVRAAFVGHPDEVASFVERIRASEQFIPELALVAEDSFGVIECLGVTFSEVASHRAVAFPCDPVSHGPVRARGGATECADDAGNRPGTERRLDKERFDDLLVHLAAVGMAKRWLDSTASSLLLAGCGPQLDHPVGVIDVRNESPQSVRVEIDQPNGDRPVTWVPTWTAGWCPVATIGLTDGGIANALQQSQIVLSGPSLAEPTTFPGIAADLLSGGLVLTVDASGAIHITHGQVPLPSAGCQSYPLDTQP